MSPAKFSIFAGVILALVGLRSWGASHRFYRIGCLEGERAQNLLIGSDEFRQAYLEFDSQPLHNYLVESADFLGPSCSWAPVASMIGDGGRVRWLTTLKWTKTFGGEHEEYGYCVRETSDGGYVVVGGMYSFATDHRDVYFMKTDAQGSLIWSKTYGGLDDDDGCSVDRTADGGYVIAGFTYSYGAGEADVYLVKTDNHGDVEWSKTYGGSEFDQGTSVRQTLDGGYIVAGSTQSFGTGDYDVYLVKTDPEGQLDWDRKYGGNEHDVAWSVNETTDNGYVLCGYTESFGAGDYDMYLIKTDAQGNLLTIAWPTERV